MSHCTMSALTVRPQFDATTFVSMSETGPLDEEHLAGLVKLYDQWLESVNAYKVDCPEGDRLLAWLDADVEERVEASWGASAHRGFLEHALAVYLLMRVVGEVVPQVSEHGCAPVAEPCATIRQAAIELGLSWPEDNTLCRRYSVTTSLPWAGGCESCHLGQDCPKLKTQYAS